MGRLQAWLERHLAAAALAEEGLYEEASRLSGARPRPRGDEALDALLRARGIRLLCGALSAAALSPRR